MIEQGYRPDGAARPPGLGDDRAAAVAAAVAADAPPPTIPGVTLGSVLGEGGAGRVFEAWQEAPRRRVAVKVLRTALEGSAGARRFLREAEILARLDHPGIARVMAVHAVPWAGATVPAIVIELVDGGLPLTRWATGRSRSERLALFREVCAAVGHAHRLGIVHRDLKPGNVLVDRHGRPKVIDFEWAHCRDATLGVETLGTRTGHLVGTHAYMSPEQFVGGSAVDCRADVWALGVMLYELLTGVPPFDLRGKSVSDTAAIVRWAMAPPVTRLDRSIPRDLAAIAASCLRQRADDRYPDAGALAADLGRHLDGMPIRAPAPGFVAGLRHLARRHRAAAAVTASVVASLIAATVGIAIHAGRTARALAVAERAREAESAALDAARDAQRRSDEATRRARWGEYVASVRHLAHPRDTVDPRGVASSFDTAVGLGRQLGIATGATGLPLELALLRGGFDAASLRVALPEGITALASSPEGGSIALGGDAGGLFFVAATGSLPPVRIDAHRSALAALCFAPGGRRLLSVATDGTARVWDVDRGIAVAGLAVTAARVGDAAFDPGGGAVAIAADDGTVRVVDADSGTQRHALRYRRGKVRTVRYRPGDGATLASGSLEGDSVLWDARTGNRIATFGGRRTRTPAVAFSPDGSLLAVPDHGNGVAIVDGLSGARLHGFAGPDAPVTGLAFAADGTTLAVAYGDRPIDVWDTGEARRVARLDGHRSAVSDVGFSPDGRWLATASSDRAVRVYDAATGSLRNTLRGHETPLRRLAWSSDGGWLATTEARTVRLWQDAVAGGPSVVKGPGGVARRLAFSADGRTLVVAWNKETRAYDVATATARHRFSTTAPGESRFALEPSSMPWVAAADGGGGVGIWTLADGSLVSRVSAREPIRALAADPATGCVVVAERDGVTRLVDPADGAVVAAEKLVPDLIDAVPSPDGTVIVAASGQGGLAVWRPATGDTRRPTGHDGKVRAVRFRPGKDQFLTVGQDRRVVLRDGATGEGLSDLTRTTEWVTAVAFSPDGARVALGTISGGLAIHRPDDGSAVVRCSGHDQRINAIAWTPDGTRLVTGSEDHTVRVWDAASGSQLVDLDGHAGPVLDVAIGPDGVVVASASADGTVRLWGQSHAEIHAARRQADR